MSDGLLLRPDRLLQDGALVPGQDVLVRAGEVVAVGPGLAAERVLTGAVLAPGFVDLHVHALDGRGMVGRDAPDVASLGRALARRGVTGFLATTVTAPLDELVAVLRRGTAGEGARCLGLHLEGPWLSRDCAGAQPREHLQPPSAAALDQLLAAGPPALITLAPELPDAVDVVGRADGAGVVVSLGHSAATYDQAVAGFDAGARHVTHCFNAMAPLHHREPGLVGAALERDHVSVEVIADGQHLHPAVVRLLHRALGPRRMCLISDAVDIAEAGGTDVAVLADGTLTGSRIGLDQAVRNVVAWGIPLADALTMASTTPAAVVGRDHRVAPGRPADLVLLDDQLQVLATVVGGEPV
jgi:N-acetylglucosamine-6-phosphate deacetylase